MNAWDFKVTTNFVGRGGPPGRRHLGSARASRARFGAFAEMLPTIDVYIFLKSSRWWGRHRQHAGGHALPRAI